MSRVTLDMIPKLFGGVEKTPGVYQQGLQMYDMAGGIIYENFQHWNILDKIYSFCRTEEMSVVAYWGDTLYANALTQHTGITEIYRDSAAVVPTQGVRGLERSGIYTHKMIIMHFSPMVVTSIRDRLKVALEGTGAV